MGRAGENYSDVGSRTGKLSRKSGTVVWWWSLAARYRDVGWRPEIGVYCCLARLSVYLYNGVEMNKPSLLSVLRHTFFSQLHSDNEPRLPRDDLSYFCPRHATRGWARGALQWHQCIHQTPLTCPRRTFRPHSQRVPVPLVHSEHHFWQYQASIGASWSYNRHLPINLFRVMKWQQCSNNFSSTRAFDLTNGRES